MFSKINKLIILVLTITLAMQVFSVSVFSYETSNISGATQNSGASFPSYSKGVEEINVIDKGADNQGKKDSTKAIQKALNYAKDNASDELQIKVFIPAGEYKVTKTLRIYSNTWLFMENDAVIKKHFDGGCMLKNTMQYGNGGYDADRNIVIEGGCWNGNTENFNGNTNSNIRIGHARNIAFLNTEVAENKNGHHLELGGIEGLTIENCSFHGYSGYLQKEAIQLDVLNNFQIFRDYEPFDDTPTNNVVIKNNHFYDLSRGIGSHSAVVGTYYTNTTISGNTFENISGICIIMYNHKHCTIENNTMNNVGMGIDFMYMSENGSTDYFNPVVGYEKASKKINDDANLIIRGNTISTNITNISPDPFGIRIFGKKVSGTKLPKYNYCVQGVKISENEIRSASKAIILDNVLDCEIIGNNLMPNFDVNNIESSNLIDVVRSSYVYINSNNFSNSKGSSIQISGGKKFSVKNNTIDSSEKFGVVLQNEVSESNISENTVRKPTEGGILVENKCSGIKVDKNTVEFSAASGIIFKKNTTEDIKCIGNTLSSSAKTGILVVSNSNILVKKNDFSSNTRNIGVGEGSYCKVATPENFAISDITEKSIAFSWDFQNEVAGYRIYRKHGSNGEYELISDQLDPNFTDESVASKTLYFYKVVPYIMQKENKQGGNSINDQPIKTKYSITKSYVEMLPEVAYTGKARTQNIKIIAQNSTLVPGIDYDIQYSSNINIGTAQVKITAKGDYCGEIIKEFKILPIKYETGAQNSRSYKNTSMITYASRNSGYNAKCTVNDYISLANNEQQKTPIEISLDAFKVQQTYIIKTRSYTIIDGTRIYGIWS